ncbi:hypothetical protein D3C78_1572820 [compost metagenome]
MHQLGQGILPTGHGRLDAWCRADHAGDQAHPDQGEDGQAKHEMPLLEQFAGFAALGEVAFQLDGGVDTGDQHQHQPVHGNGKTAIAVRSIRLAHHGSSEARKDPLLGGGYGRSWRLWIKRA